MGKLTKANPNASELLTESFDKSRWWNLLNLIVEFLHSRGVEKVRIEFGFVMNRDPDGNQAKSQVVELRDLEAAIKKGFDDGTIEWARNSDFLFYPEGIDLVFMLCNDADLHFASADFSMLMELGHKIRSSEIKVYDSGRLI